jgi:hypothetical protein
MRNIALRVNSSGLRKQERQRRVAGRARCRAILLKRKLGVSSGAFVRWVEPKMFQKAGGVEERGMFS